MYDLWEGRIRSRDEAVQLLLIVDYIHAWAGDYRDTILKCIQGGANPVRRSPPAASSCEYAPNISHMEEQKMFVGTKRSRDADEEAEIRDRRQGKATRQMMRSESRGNGSCPKMTE